MKTSLRYFLAAVLIAASFRIALADDFKSQVISSAGFGPIRVHGDQFMVIRNFTQEGSTADTRGEVLVKKPATNPDQVSVLTAAILDPTQPPEVINTVVIAGPADVSVTCGAATGNCFISYKKEAN